MKNKNRVFIYVGFAYLISWLTYIPLALNHHGIIFLFPDEAANARLQDVWHAAGAFGPVLAASWRYVSSIREIAGNNF